MCLFTKYVDNPRYKANKKNKGIIPECKDERLKLVPVKCGNCKQCRKAKAREWAIRLNIERKNQNNKAQFVTLTFDDKSITELEKEAGTKKANEVVTLAIKRFNNRWIQKHKKACKHWFITELGHEGTERIHVHGIMFTDQSKKEIKERWGYGRVDVGYSMNEKVINYVVKYIMKEDKDHIGFKPKMFPSPGIGRDWMKENRSYQKFKGKNTNDHLRTSNGAKVAMPTYYRRKQYTEEEREELWLNKLDEGITYINGHKINTNSPDGEKKYAKALEWARYISRRDGYGDGNFMKKDYMTTNGIKKV